MTATERPHSVIKSSPTIYRLVHYIHTTYNMQNIVKNGIMYKNLLILILILILCYYRCIGPTLDNCLL